MTFTFLTMHLFFCRQPKVFVVGICPVRAMATERANERFQWVVDKGLGGSSQQLYGYDLG
jgi:hypothetical protein